MVQDPNTVSSASSGFVRVSDRTLLIITIEERQKVSSHPRLVLFR